MKTIIKKSTISEDATDSDPPWEMGWAKELNLEGYAVNWANADNEMVCDVYWGIPIDGYFKSNNNMYWKKDDTLTVTVVDGSALNVNVPFFLNIPIVKARHVKIVFNLTGTNHAVDVVAWFSGRSA